MTTRRSTRATSTSFRSPTVATAPTTRCACLTRATNYEPSSSARSPGSRSSRKLHPDPRQPAALRCLDDPLDALLRFENLALCSPLVQMDFSLDLVHLADQAGDFELNAAQLAAVTKAPQGQIHQRHRCDDAEAAADQDEDVDSGMHPQSLANHAAGGKDAAVRTSGF